jgi:hypothetical protein
MKDQEYCVVCDSPATHITYSRGARVPRCGECWANWIRTSSDPSKPEKQLLFTQVGYKQ